MHLVSLGCPKNRVDSELMLGRLRQDGWAPVGDAEDADVIVVNTCAFIESAKKESVDTILEMIEHKERGSARRIVVTGCMAQRYGDELARELPEVDAFLGTNDFKRISGALSGTLPERTYLSAGSALYTAEEERVNTVRGGSAYVKIAEGCSRACSFCIIPRIRGRQQSRQPDDIVREIRLLARGGVREVSLIAQDLTSYGTDLGRRDGLEDLLRRLSDLPGPDWIRLHYAYPWNLTDGILEILGAGGRVLPYVDMPLQHISDRLLGLMRRNVRRAEQRRLIERLRGIDGMVIRTVFITGFPGETDTEFEELCDWVREVEFDRVGVFPYSLEEDTEAYDLPDRVPAEIAEERCAELMRIQAGISRRRNEAMIGRRLRVLVDGVSEEHEWVMEGRWYGQSLDIDGVVYLSFEEGAEPARPGQFVEVEIDDATEHDLKGNVLAPDAT